MINQKQLYEDEYNECYYQLQDIFEDNPEYFESKKNIENLVNSGYYDLAMIFCSPVLKKDSEFISNFAQYELIEQIVKVENISHSKESIENPDINIWGQEEESEKYDINILINDKKMMVKKTIHSVPLQSTDEMNINIDLYLQEKHIANCEICIDSDLKIQDTIAYKLVKVFDIESCTTPEISEYKVSLRKGEWDIIMGMKLASKNTLK